jgi:hypothetical protein
MKKIWIALMILFCLPAVHLARAEKVVEHQVNKGNISKMFSYYDDDHLLMKTEAIFSGEEIVKIITFYDRKRKKKERMETYFTEKFAKENGVFRNTVYYDGEERKIRDESLAKNTNILRIVTLYNPAGKKISQENFFTEKVAGEKGFDRGIRIYDPATQRVEREEFYLKNVLVGAKGASGQTKALQESSSPIITGEVPHLKEGGVPKSARMASSIAVFPAFLSEPVILSDRAILPARLESGLNINQLSQAQYAGAVTSAKETIRFLSGAASPRRQQIFEAQWAPLYDDPNPALNLYLNKVNPLLLSYATLHQAMGRVGLEHDQAMDAARDAASKGNEDGALTALSILHQKQLMMASLLKQMESVAGQIQLQGKPPEPRQAKARAKQRHQKAVARLLPVEEEGEIDGFWMSDEKWTYSIHTGMGTSQISTTTHTFSPSFFLKKVKKIDERLDIYFVRDFFPKPYGNGEPGERQSLIVLEREEGGGYAQYADMDYPEGRQSYLASGGYIRYQAEWFPFETVRQKDGSIGLAKTGKVKYATWTPERLSPELERLAKMSPDQLIGLVLAKRPKLSMKELVKAHRAGMEQFKAALAGPRETLKPSKPASPAVTAATQQPPQKIIQKPVPKGDSEQQERIREKEALIDFFRNDIRSLEQQLKTNPGQAETIRWLIMNRKSDIILEQDRIREIQTGEFLRSRTPFDDHCLAQIVVSAQKEVSRLATANRNYRAAVALIGKLPYEEQQQAWKTLETTVKSGGSTDPEVIGRLKNALRDKYQGRIDQDAAKAEERMLDADDLVTRAEKVKGSADAAVGLLSLVTPGGRTIDKVYRSFTGSIDAATDPDASATGGVVQAGLNVLEVWTGDILEKTRFKAWKDSLSAMTSGLNATQKEYQKARKEGKEKPATEAVAQGLSTGIWSYITGKSGDRLVESGGANGLIVDQCIQTVNSAPGTVNALLRWEPGQDEIPGVDKLLAQGAITDLEYLQRQFQVPMVVSPAAGRDGAAEPPLIANQRKRAVVSSQQIEKILLPELQRQSKKAGSKAEGESVQQDIQHWTDLGGILKQTGDSASDPVTGERLMEYLTGGRSVGDVIAEIEKIAAGLQRKKP